jgi:preprotein translocase subunit SecE
VAGHVDEGFEVIGRMAKSPFQFVDEVRQEINKVTWPTWKEVWITTIMVLIMVAISSIFFLLADQALGWLVKTILSLGV